MAKEYKLEVQKRDSTKKSDLKKYRKDGMIPGVYYSFDSKESINFLVTQSEIKNAIKSDANIFAISVGGDNRNVLFKSVQYHPITEAITHIDLYGVNMKKAVVVKVNLDLIGDSIGIKEEGGILNQTAKEVDIKCLPLDIPNSIEIDISALSIGDTILASQITLGDNIELMSPEDMLIVSVTLPMKEVEPEVEEELEEGEEGEEGEGGTEASDAASAEGSDKKASSDSGDNS
jgi:large subunit ribosomal protein L25